MEEARRDVRDGRKRRKSGTNQRLPLSLSFIFSLFSLKMRRRRRRDGEFGMWAGARGEEEIEWIERKGRREGGGGEGRYVSNRMTLQEKFFPFLTTHLLSSLSSLLSLFTFSFHTNNSSSSPSLYDPHFPISPLTSTTHMDHNECNTISQIFSFSLSFTLLFNFLNTSSFFHLIHHLPLPSFIPPSSSSSSTLPLHLYQWLKPDA